MPKSAGRTDTTQTSAARSRTILRGCYVVAEGSALKRRLSLISKLAGGVAVIRVGGATEVEVNTALGDHAGNEDDPSQ